LIIFISGAAFLRTLPMTERHEEHYAETL